MPTPLPSKLDERQILQGVYDEDNGRLRTTSEATVINADINVNLDAASGDNVAIHDSNGDELKINTDGSINVSVVNASNGITRSIFNEISPISSNSPTSLVSYTVPLSKTAILDKIVVSGENIAKFEVYINSNKVDVTRTYFGSELNGLFDYSSNNSGYTLQQLDLVEVVVTHFRPDSARFEGRIQVVEI
jgi:hypothetical protein